MRERKILVINLLATAAKRVTVLTHAFIISLKVRMGYKAMNAEIFTWRVLQTFSKDLAN